MLKDRQRGIGLADLIATMVLIALVGAIGFPVLERSRELSKRLVCGINLKALGGAAEVYADANKGQWMIPNFRKASETVAYLCHGPNRNFIACVGYLRDKQSRTNSPQFPAAGSTAISTTRAYWMLVRSGDVPVEQLVCPSSMTDTPDPTVEIDSYYDFEDYSNISYGYLVPFGPAETQPRRARDHRVIFAADKGPYYRVGFLGQGRPIAAPGKPIEVNYPPQVWRPYNSPNHGGLGSGEGQNALYADGGVEFHRNPAIGLDQDNIYTLMSDEWDIYPYNRMFGLPPHDASSFGVFPGEDAFGPNSYSTTDSLIYP